MVQLHPSKVSQHQRSDQFYNRTCCSVVKKHDYFRITLSRIYGKGCEGFGKNHLAGSGIFRLDLTKGPGFLLAREPGKMSRSDTLRHLGLPRNSAGRSFF